MSVQSSVSTHQRPVDVLENGYINVVESDEHKNELTREMLEACSNNFSKPVLFRNLVPLGPEAESRKFLDVHSDESLLWREKTDDSAVTFRDENGKTDYNYVTGREGTASEYLDEIFKHRKDVYAHLGKGLQRL